MLDGLRQDVHYGLRALRLRPGFTAAAVLTLALGLGAATAVFSVIDGVLLKPLPVPAQERVLVVWKTVPARGFDAMPFTWASYEELRDRLDAAHGVAAHPYHGSGRGLVRRGADVQPLRLAGVTGAWFDVLGVQPVAGRLIAPADDRVGAPRVLVLAVGAARRLFGDARAALGQTVRVDELSFEVVGIAPDDLAFPGGAEAWTAATPLYTVSPQPAASLREAVQLAWNLVVRVAPGRTVEQTRAELAALLPTLATESALLGEQRIRAPLIADVVTGEVRPALLLLGGAVLLVLIMAVVNVANLLLARGLARRRELAVRAAVGASRGRVARQLATEAVVLVVASVPPAVLAGSAALRVLLRFAPPELPRVGQIAIDGRALAFTALAALVVAVCVGVLPALRTAALRSPGLHMRRGDTGGPRASVLRHGLVVAQVALAAVVLSMAGLMLRSLDRLQRLDAGFDARDMMLVEVAIPLSRYETESAHQQALMRLAERAAQVAGVAGASAVVVAPFSGSGGIDAVWHAEASDRDQTANPYANYEGVDGAYFETMGLRIVRGRAIDAGDRADSRRVVVVNETFARSYWPGEDPVGRRVKLGTAESADAWRTVVGVAADARYRALTEVRPSVYVPYAQGIPVRPRYLAVRTDGGATIVPALRRLIADEEPSASVAAVAPLPALLAVPLARPRFQSALGGFFAVLGLMLSAIGTYGVVAFFVRQRTHEIGIRMALGAEAVDVRWLVLRQGLVIGTLGVAIGITGAVAAGRAIRSVLFDAPSVDPLVLVTTATVLLAACLAAAAVPTRAALRADPLRALRSE
jgi:predicted permease